MKKPEDTSLHELGADARVARIFRWSVIAAAVLTLIVALGLLAWWLSRDTPVAADEIAVLPPEPLMEPGRLFPLSDVGSNPTPQSGGKPPHSIVLARLRS